MKNNLPFYFFQIYLHTCNFLIILNRKLIKNLDQAIISGANGLIGYELTKYLISKNIKVICLGNKIFNQTNLANLPLNKDNYFCLSMNKISSLPKLLEDRNIDIENKCVFYNFAWRGKTKLTDGNITEQLNNAIYSAEAVKSASKLGCCKFINVGTIEESNAENYLNNKYPEKHKQNQIFYTIAKLSSRDMCLITAYIEKIDYVHTRLSVPLDPSLKKGSYISSTLKKILDKEIYTIPRSTQLYDIIFIDEVVNSYYLIGKNGKNKANYFIGTGKPLTLNQYFNYFKNILKDEYKFPQINYTESDLKIFSTETLELDTGFKVQKEFKDIKNYLKI